MTEYTRLEYVLDIDFEIILSHLRPSLRETILLAKLGTRSEVARLFPLLKIEKSAHTS